MPRRSPGWWVRAGGTGVVSVIIPTHNRSALLREALDSVMAQEPCGDEVEVVVVDDDSTDDTAEVVAQYPAVRYARTRQGSAPGARNEGMRQARGEWLAFLDDDDVWLPQKLRRCMEAAREDPGARFLFSAATICDAALKPGPMWTVPAWCTPAGAFDALLEALPPTPAVMLHREVVDAVGMFDPSLPRGEDRDLWYRIVEAGFRCCRIAEPLVLVRVAAELDGEVVRRGFGDTMRVLSKHLSADNPLRPGWRRRREVLRRTRGWYAHQMLRAAEQEERRGRRNQAVRYRRLAFAMSPLHALAGVARWRPSGRSAASAE